MVLVSVLFLTSKSGVSSRCIDLALSAPTLEQTMPCPVFSGPGNRDEQYREPKSVRGRNTDLAASSGSLG